VLSFSISPSEKIPFSDTLIWPNSQ
jgi:hypothetical protein